MFADRPGGYTRITQLPHNRLGDCASRVIFELVTKTADVVATEDEDDSKTQKAKKKKGEETDDE